MAALSKMFQPDAFRGVKIYNLSTGSGRTLEVVGQVVNNFKYLFFGQIRVYCACFAPSCIAKHPFGFVIWKISRVAPP